MLDVEGVQLRFFEDATVLTAPASALSYLLANRL
jgi:hypothetical protein